jgi:serine/threonine protein kinase
VPPELIAGRYRIEREVGRGGMGSVWLCRDERLGRQVAAKQVGGLPGESNLHLARALREARHSAALNHPNVVAIFDALEDGDHVWLVMEYVPSRTLDQIVREGGRLEPRVAARIGADVADGLAAAHALGTVHRDVKPSNVLVRESDGRALIADFGIARTVGQEQLTRSGLVTGTPAYFAPELARGYEPSPASDVWALGISLHFAVEGELPYAEEANAIAMLNTIANQPPPEPTRAGPLGPALRRMLDPDPETRATMAQTADELRQLAVAVPTPDPAPEAETEVVEPVPVPVPTGRPPDTVPTAVVAPAPRRRRGPLLLLAGLLLLALVAAGGWWLTRGPDEGNPEPSATGVTHEPSGTPHGSSAHVKPSSRPPSASSSATPPSSRPSPSPSSSPSSPSSSPSSSTSPSSSSSPSSAAGVTDAGSPAELVAHYYGLLPDDTATAWELLTPGLRREIGRGTFDGFWATIDDVQVEGTEEVGSGLVRVTLTYVTDGRSETETRQLGVERSGAGYLISDDQGAV